MTTSGIDVSQWQGAIDWAKVKAAGVQFALIRAGYGNTLSYPKQIDTKYEANYKGCKAAGIPVGVYFYSYATTTAEAQREADSCIALLKGKQFEYPIYYDVEEMRTFKTGKTNEIIQAFADKLEAAGYWVGIYIYRSAAERYLTSRTKSRYSMAIAEYASSCHYSGSYGIWQNTSSWTVNGISGRVDHDYCYRDYPTEIKAKGKNGYPKPSTEFRIETTADADILFGTSTADAPPVQACVPKGRQYTIDKTVTIDGQTFGKIKEKPEKADRSRWIALRFTKKV